ncbi:MAG: AAA family ATPase [Acidimicrobiales bacterium]
MRLNRVRISNHSRLVDTDVSVRKHLVLVGSNDVGKSSLLRCLDLLLGASTASLYTRITPDDFRDKTEPFVVEVGLSDFSDADRALFPDEILVNSSDQTSSLTLRLVVTVDENDTISIERTAPGGLTGRQLSREQVIGIGWKFLSATSQSRDLREDRRSAIDDILQNLDLGAEKPDFESATAVLAQKLRDSEILGDLRGSLANQLTKALTQRVERDDLVFVAGADADADVLSDVRLQVIKDGAQRNLSDQSDGTRALFAMALYDLTSVGANMVGIDEPEIHLHPTSQRSLAKLLQNSPNQKFIATHSPDIVGAFDPDCIAVVRTGGFVTQPSAGFLSQDEKLAVHWWVRNKLEPLTANRVIAVEGISDRILLERIGDLTDRSLDRLGLCVVETGGSGGMVAVEKLFGETGFDLPMSQLIDEDAISSTARRLGIVDTELNSRSVWINEPDLEAEYVSALGSDPVWAAIEASGLFSRNERSNCALTGAGGIRTDEDVSSFCRKENYKVKAALVVAPMFDLTSATRMNAICNLLGEIDPS